MTPDSPNPLENPNESVSSEPPVTGPGPAIVVSPVSPVRQSRWGALRVWARRELQTTEELVERDMLPIVRIERWVRRQHRLVHLGMLSACGLLLATIGTLWVVPHRIAFSYADAQSCAFAPVLLPGVYTGDPHAPFTITRPASVSLLGVKLFASTICVAPKVAPKPGATYQTRQVINIFGRQIPVGATVATGTYATAKMATPKAQALSLTEPLAFQLSSQDGVFDYALSANDRLAPCAKQAAVLRCNLEPLQLTYSTSYQLKLMRLFRNHPVGEVTSVAVTTITAAAITNTTIAAGSVVYDSPQQVTLTVSKPLRAVGAIMLSASLNGQTSNIAVTHSIVDTVITVHFSQVLPRRASMDLHISQVVARDGSQLEQPYDLKFQTSGGPKVTGTSIGGSGVSLYPTVSIYFDQTLEAGQATSGLASLTANGALVATQTVVNGNRLVVTLSSSLPRCAVLSLRTTSGVISQYGFSGDSAWSYSSRTLCYTTFSIGTSVQGRSITAYQFGPGGNLVLYIAAMHGNESNTAQLMYSWIDELDAYPDRIPAGRTIVVIPEINPDGVAANTRENAHHIDLNRNFPTNDWQTQVTEPWSNGQMTDEGGPSPLSEPESQAIASYIQAQHPRLVLTYHSHAGVVEANDAGDSNQLGATYGAKSGYSAIPAYAIGNTFDYSTTGAMEDWMRDKLGWPALLVELWTSYSKEFYTNQDALWAMAQVQ